MFTYLIAFCTTAESSVHTHGQMIYSSEHPITTAKHIAEAMEHIRGYWGIPESNGLVLQNIFFLEGEN